jgi:hypothetical protein
MEAKDKQNPWLQIMDALQKKIDKAGNQLSLHQGS